MAFSPLILAAGTAGADDSGSALLPAWLVLPVAGFVLLVIAGHTLSLHAQNIPPRRRRIRTACGFIMMFVTGLLAYALAIQPDPHSGVAAGSAGVVGTGHGQSFVLVWTLIVAMLALMIVLAAADAAHTLYLGSVERRALRSTIGSPLNVSARGARQAAPGHAGESERA